MASTCQIDVLEKRIERLEALVFGNADKDALYPKCIDNLSNIQSKVVAATAGRKKIPKAYERLPDLQNYLDPSYTEELTTSNDTKAEIILAEEDFLRQQATRLERMQNLEELFDSEHIKATPKLAGKLHELSQIQIKQQDQASQFNDEARACLEAYNSIVTLLSKQFVQWDEILTKAEIAAQPRKSKD
ncbi:dynactin subunit 3-like isoform X2 [Haliotis asinina]|uniref:dynactin subunit 3-like isoform X2 n=1 Tax=Haliotis asinina TaxID=109174 RepID=UPI00353236E9